MSQKFSDIVDSLVERGWALKHDFLPVDAIESLLEEAREHWLAGRFLRAGVGRGSERQIRADVRGDHILWLDESSLTMAQSRYWSEIESLRVELNRELFLGLVSFEAHYAYYPAGAFYRRHIDRFSDSDERTLSISLYLNPDWKEEEGGQLRLYTSESGPRAVASESFAKTLDGDSLATARGTDLEAQVEIFPQAGTLVIFKSDTVPHEVAPAKRERFSLTGWFKRRGKQGHFPFSI